MKTESSKDIIIILVLTILSTIGLFTPHLGTYHIIPYILLMFILPGCSFIMAVCPLNKDLSRKTRFFLSIEATILIGILFFVVSGHNPLQIESTMVFLIMAVLTIFLVLTTFLERHIFSKDKKNNTYETTDESDEKKAVENESIEGERKDNDEEENYSVNDEEQYPVNNEEQYPVNNEEQYPVNNEENYPANNEENYPVNNEENYSVNDEEQYSVNNEEQYSVNNEENYSVNDEELYLDNDYEDYQDKNDETDQTNSGNENVDKKESRKRFIPTDLILMFVVTALCVVFLLAPRLNTTFVKTILELFLILFIPGYALMAALFPRKDDLEDIERTALSFGLSVTITPIIGLALHYTIGGIKLTPLLLLLSVFTFIMISVALIRVTRVLNEERFTVPFRMNKNCEGKSKSSKILSILLVITIVLAVATTVYIELQPPHQEEKKFTEFYILGSNSTSLGSNSTSLGSNSTALGSNGTTLNYPTNLTVGKNGSVIVGIVNHENQPVNYQFVVTSNGKIISQQNVTVDNTQELEIPYNFTVGSTGTKDLEFRLYKLPDQNNIYRSMHLEVNVK